MSVCPPPQSIFEPERDCYGWRLALVFGNHAADGECPYYAASRCHHCDIGKGEGAAFDRRQNLRRLRWFRNHYADILDGVNHLIYYNSGSVLNPREMSVDVLDELIAFARSLPALKVLSLDSREAYITEATIRRVANALGPDRTVRPIIGLETSDDHLRDEVLDKKMPRTAVYRAFETVGTVANELGPRRVGVDVNVLVGAPGTTRKTAVADAVETARFALDCGRQVGIPVDLNIHPYYPSRRGLAGFPQHPRCHPQIVAQAALEIVALCRSLSVTGAIFIGWHDEGHDQQPVQRAKALDPVRDCFGSFNSTQDPTRSNRCSAVRKFSQLSALATGQL